MNTDDEPLRDNVEAVGKHWVLKADTGISAEAKKHGTIAYDPVFLNLPELDALPKGSLVIDAGAFIGDITRIFLDKGFFVVAFEPQVDAQDCLLHNCPEAFVCGAVLGDGRSVSLEQKSAGNLGARNVVPGGDQSTTRLDFYRLQNVRLLKLDCEGFEPAILEGARELLAQPSLQYVIVECNPTGLAQYGWTVADILKYFPHWPSRELFRYGEQNWDLLLTRPA